MIPGNSVITFATNKESYLQFAFNLAQSVLRYNDLKVYIVSNLTVRIPKHLEGKVNMIQPKPQHAELGIGMKLYIDEYLQTEHTLFIDSDCLCYGDLSPIFNACANKKLSVAGSVVPAAEFCGQQQADVIKKNFGLTQLIRFNGGFYYLRQSEITRQIFSLAKSIIPNYDKFGFNRLANNWLNEEGLLSIAMMKFGETPLPDNGRYFTDLYTDPHPAELNVLTGKRILINPPAGQAKHRPWYPVGNYSPLILHFGGQKLNSFPYVTQNALLQLSNNLIPAISKAIVSTFLVLPYKTTAWFLTLLRKLKTN